MESTESYFRKGWRTRFGDGLCKRHFKTCLQSGILERRASLDIDAEKKNLATHIYNEEEIEEMLLLIRESFLPAFESLKELFLRKQEEIEKDEQGL